MDKTSMQKLNLGLFVIIGTILLITALYFIGNRQNLFGKTFKISAVFDNVNGLQLGNNVRFSGINVGTVKGITMINDSSICVDMLIEKHMLNYIKRNAVAAIGSDGLVGSMLINIVPGKELSTNIKHGDTIISYSRITSNDMLATLNTTNENAALLTSDLLKITTEINHGKGTLTMLLKDTELSKNIKNTVEYFKSASFNINKTVVELNKIITDINNENSVAGVILKDSISAAKIKAIIINLDESTKNINTTVNSLNEVIANLKNSQGPYQYLVNDTIAVKNIDETVKNLKESSVKLNENLEALKHSFLLRGYFKKKERAREKQLNNK